MKLSVVLILPLLCLSAAAQTTPTPGSGAPTVAIQQSFQREFFQNNFQNLVNLPPLGNVKALGSQGLVQEFSDVTNTANKYALIKPNINTPTLAIDADMVQMYPGIYSYYTGAGLGPTTAGYPTTSTLNCPGLVSVKNNSCQYQLFDKPYALFVYASNLSSGTVNFATGDPFYTKWQSLGGIAAAGPATTAAIAITSASGIAATVQTFDQAAIFNITSGALSGRLVAVGPHMFATYAASQSYTGVLGLPLTDEQLLANGHKHQNFEGGAIDYDPASGIATLQFPIYSISTTPSVQSLKLNLGDSATLTATPFDANGNALTSRSVVWSTSNLGVVTIQASGLTATIKAVGGGTAVITVSGEGKTSPPISVFVAATCCGIGEGAPTPAIQQAFQAAATRDRLTLQVPTATPVSRAGSGYIQTFQDANTGAAYLLAVPDGSASAYVLTGAILAAYQTLGGPSGSLGYPISDATPGGRQLFSNKAALAGTPLQVVSGVFLNKWAALNYETGAAGAPTSGVSSVLSFRATLGTLQNFANGPMAAAQTGPLAGQVFFVSGSVAAAYAQAGGAAGSLGLPTSDEYVSGAKRHQDFEGGYVDYTPGDAAAQVQLGNRQPLITATPSAVLVGTRVRLAVGGFDPGATIRVSITGQPDFTVKTDTGAYAWESVVPANAKTGSVALHAVDTKTSASADGAYTIQTATGLHVQVSKTAGDGQTGFPGAVLPQPLEILVADAAGNPVVGAPVQFSASPGAQIVTADAITDGSGTARASVRAPAADGLALIAAGTGSQIVTFSVQVAHGSLLNFPKFSQSDPQWGGVALGNGPATIAQSGDLVTAAAAILRFYQNQGVLPTPNGFADPLALNRFLTAFCASGNQGSHICDGFLTPQGSPAQIVNLWRLAAFVGGNLDVSLKAPDPNVVRDLLGQGAPILLALSVNSLSHYVVATGVAANGEILIVDSNSVSGQTNLSAYPPGSLQGAVQLIPRAPASPGFLITGTTGFQIASPAGACPSLPDKAAVTFTMTFCDGTQSLYQLDAGGSGPLQLTLTDLANPGNRTAISGSASFGIFRSGAQWTAAPQSISFTMSGIVNAATYTPDLAPGGIFTVFGSGLFGPGNNTSVQVGGETATVIAQTPFQVSAMMPADLAPGSYPVTVSSAFGSAAQNATILNVAPAIFSVGVGQAAILNQDGTLNTPSNPAQRGSAIVIYCTGLGATIARGSLAVAVSPVTVMLSGVKLTAAFAGLAPGFPGLYQVNLITPASTPPGAALVLSLQQANQSSNTVEVAIQ